MHSYIVGSFGAEKRKTQRKSDDGSGQKMVHRDLAQQTDFEGVYLPPLCMHFTLH